VKFKFAISLWGKKYIYNFCNYFLNIYNSDCTKNAIVKYLSKDSEFTIYTLKNDIQYFDKKIIEKINEYIKINIKELDEGFIKKERNKYTAVSAIQNLIINESYDFDYLFFLYPDFVFNENSISNVIKLINKNMYDAIFSPVPRIIKNNDIIKHAKNNQLTKYIKSNLHIFDRKSFLNDLRANPSIFIDNSCDDFWLFKCLHLHPIIVKNLNSEDYYKPFGPTLDEDFIKIYHNKNYKVLENSNEIFFCSLTEKDEILLKDQSSFDISTFYFWLEEHSHEIHRNFFTNNTYALIFDKFNYSEEILTSNIDKLDSMFKKLFPSIYMNNKLINEYHHHLTYIRDTKLDKSFNFEFLDQKETFYKRKKHK
jgi:hypothetical protein